MLWGCWGLFNWCLVRLEGGDVGIFGVLWRFDVCIGRFRGCWGRFMGCLGVLEAFWNITIHVRCLDSFCVQLLVCKDASPM